MSITKSSSITEQSKHRAAVASDDVDIVGQRNNEHRANPTRDEVVGLTFTSHPTTQNRRHLGNAPPSKSLGQYSEKLEMK